MKYLYMPIIRWTLLLAMLLAAFAAAAQSVEVRGNVRNPAGEPLIGATVTIRGATRGVLTDGEGRFTIQTGPLDTLAVSYFGYLSQRVPVMGRTSVEVVLEEAPSNLDEVVIVGYGVQRKSDLTGSVSSVKAEELNRIPTASVEQALQGKVAGVQVTPVSGAPGAGAIIRIRGVGTLNDASPLFVVDGLLLNDISFLNVQDIQSVEVLKDASATAIYGSRGANGVIIITTRQGVQGPKTSFEASAYYGMQQVIRKIDLLNGSEFAELANELAANENRPPIFSNPASYGEGTDWQDEIFGLAPIQNYQVSAGGGNALTTYHLSANYFHQEGIVTGSDFDRLTLRLNNAYTLAPRVKVGHNLAFIYRTNRNVPGGVVANAYRASPTVPAIDSAGRYGQTTRVASVANPVAEVAFYDDNSEGYRAVGNLFADVELLKGLTFRTNLGLDLSFNQGKVFVPKFEVSDIQRNVEDRLSVNTDRNFNWLWENTLSWQREWAAHRVGLLGGITAQENTFEFLGGSRIGFPDNTPLFYYLSAGQETSQTNYNLGESWSMVSYLFRANYTLLNRYLLTASFRADGSSKFGPSNRYGYFPSVALGWNIAEEAFMQPLVFVSRLKLRGSWGVIGNEKIGAYRSQAIVTPNLNAVFGPQEFLNFGASIINLANPNIRWEQTAQTNIGLELGLLDDRFLAEIDWYNRLTQGILVDLPIPDYIGAANRPVVNAAEVLNRGVDLNLIWRETRGKWSYVLRLNGSTVHNEVVSLGEGNEEIFGGGIGEGGKLGTRTTVGLPIGAFFGYQVEGVFQNQSDLETYPKRGNEVPGDLRFADIDNDGVITTADRTFIGSPIPDLVYGGGVELSFAGIDLAVDLNGVYGNELINAKQIARFGTYNFESSFLERWTGEGTSNAEPRITNGGPNYEVSERFIEDGSFTRLRSVVLGYTLPQAWSDAVKLRRVRLYVNGNNLFTWARYSGYTPEITTGSVLDVGIDRGVYPVARTLLGGIDVSF